MPWSLDGAGAAKGTPYGPHALGRSYYTRLNPTNWTIPNNYGEYNAYMWEGIVAPAGTQMGMITASVTGRSGANSAGSWHLYHRLRNGGTVTGWEKIDQAHLHNYGDQHASLNTTLQSWFTLASGYNAVDVHVNADCDGAGAAWSIHAGRIRVDWVGV